MNISLREERADVLLKAGFGTCGSGEAATAPTSEKPLIELRESSVLKFTVLLYAMAISV
jgi:hypothetical protein